MPVRVPYLVSTSRICPRCVCASVHKYRTFTSSNSLLKKEQLPPRPSVPEEETFKRYLKGSGPGGQKINKTSSAVQLTHLPTGIVVKSQATRSRTQNESIARRILAEKVEVLEKGPESRVEKKRQKVSLKKQSSAKKSRRKYRRLAEEKGQKEGENEENGDEDGNEEHGDNILQHEAVSTDNQKIK